jgi:DNA-binding SARP family transcriptional activator
VVDTYLFESNDYKPLDVWIRWLDERMARNPLFPTVDIETAVLSSMVGAGLWRQLSHPHLRSYVQRLTDIYLSETHTFLCPRTLFLTVMYYSWMGDIGEAGFILEQVHKRIGPGSFSPLFHITLTLIQAHLSIVSGKHPDTVKKFVAEGCRLADESGIHLMDYLLLGQEGYGALAHGAEGLSDSYLAKLESTIRPDRELTCCLYVDMLALHHLHRGKPEQALLYAKESEIIASRFGMVFMKGASYLLHAQACLDMGDTGGAIEKIHQAEDIFKQLGSRYFLYSCTLVKACIHLEQGNDREGIPLLRQALARGREGRFASAPYVWRRNVICRLCVKALEAGIETDFVRDMIRKQNLRPALAPVDIEALPWPVRIYTLGRFSLMVHDEPVSVSGKTQKKPLLLLKALIAVGGRDIKEETLADLLWPDAEGDAGHNAFTTTLARLRKLIGDDSAIQLSGGRVSLDNRTCWVDRWAFERLCSRTDTVLEKIQNGLADLESLKKIAAKAAGLYQGAFLGSDGDPPWSVAPRERLRSRYLHLVGQTGTFLAQEGDDEAAIRYYRKGLEAEPLAEYLHQSLISAYLRLDRLAEALAAFKQCRKILDSHSIPLSQKTENLKRQIHKN